MKITLPQALEAQKHLQKTQQYKPEILNAKGDAGMAVYFLKHAIQDAFKAHFERVNDLRQENFELLKKREENKTGLSKKDQQRFDEITKEFEKLNDVEEEVSLKTGKIKVSQIKNLVDVETLEALDFAIDFEENGKKKKAEA